MAERILVSPEVLRRSAKGLAEASSELTSLIRELEQVRSALPNCWVSPNTQGYLEKLEAVYRRAKQNYNTLSDIQKELNRTADAAEAAEREIRQNLGFWFPKK